MFLTCLIGSSVIGLFHLGPLAIQAASITMTRWRCGVRVNSYLCFTTGRLLEIIQNKIDLGLPINSSVNQEFQKKTKHRNFIFSNGIDFIYEFFKYESKTKNNFLVNSLKFIGSKKSINNMLKKIADTGFNY